jgi:hypothetical protein
MEFEIVIAKLWIKLCSLLIMDIIYWWNLSKNSERKRMALLQLALVVRAVLVKQGKVLILVSMYLLFWFGCGLLKKGVCCCLGFSLNFFSVSWLLKLNRKGGICFWLYCYINGELLWWSWWRERSGFYRFWYLDQESWGLQLLIFCFTMSTMLVRPLLNYHGLCVHRFPRLIMTNPLNLYL